MKEVMNAILVYNYIWYIINFIRIHHRNSYYTLGKVTPTYVFTGHSWGGLGAHMECKALNLVQPHAKQILN